jgi:hypothetical protein
MPSLGDFLPRTERRLSIAHHESGWSASKKGKLSLRSRVACYGWIVILAILLASVVLFSETEVETLLILSMVYGLQGWLAELIGVKVDASGIAFPNRIFPQFPYLVLFRRKLSEGSFDRIDFANEHLLVIHSAGQRIIVSTPTRFNGIAVAKYLRKQFPKVSVALLY